MQCSEMQLVLKKIMPTVQEKPVLLNHSNKNFLVE